MKIHLIIYIALALLACGMASCSENTLSVDEPVDAEGMVLKLQMTHPGSRTRATATDFETGDKTGVFVTIGDKPLQVGGNVVNNEAMTYNGSEWKAARMLYWDEGTYNVFAYYPYIDGVSSIEDQPFSVSLDQNSG